MKTKVLYAGTFDPPTLGHEWMIKEALKLFDHVVVAIGKNAEKKTKFSLDERMDMLRKICKPFKNVTIDSFEKKYIAHYATSIGATTLVRGIRDAQDFEYERTMRHVNSDIDSDIKTVFFMPPRELVAISSSFVKSLIGPERWEEVIVKFVSAPVFEEIVMKEHSIWSDMVAMGVKGDERKFWREIFDAYGSDNKRYYHTIFHLASMLADFDEIKHLLKNPLAVKLAILFHDFIYIDLSAANERQSAEHAGKTLRALGLPEELVLDVERLIQVTKHEATFPKEHDARYLVDLDLAIFGKQEKEFDEYERGIRMEYKKFPDEVFNPERIKILKNIFLNRKNIYATQFFRNKYGKMARKNLARSIKKLEGK